MSYATSEVRHDVVAVVQETVTSLVEDRLRWFIGARVFRGQNRGVREAVRAARVIDPEHPSLDKFLGECGR
jgi:hypothetical protein